MSFLQAFGNELIHLSAHDQDFLSIGIKTTPFLKIISPGMKPRLFGIIEDTHPDVRHFRQPFNCRTIGSAQT